MEISNNKYQKSRRGSKGQPLFVYSIFDDTYYTFDSARKAAYFLDVDYQVLLTPRTLVKCEGRFLTARSREELEEKIKKYIALQDYYDRKEQLRDESRRNRGCI